MVSFWQLGLPELSVPVKAYETTTARLEVSMARLDTWTGQRSLAADWVDAYHSNRMELSSLVDKLKVEQQDQAKLVATAAARVESEKEHWFPGKRLFVEFQIDLPNGCFLLPTHREGRDPRETVHGWNASCRLLLSTCHLQHSRCPLRRSLWSIPSRREDAQLLASAFLRRGRVELSLSQCLLCSADEMGESA